MDGQLVLLEISQQDGAWPRSQLQSMLEAEEEEAQAQSAVSCFLAVRLDDLLVVDDRCRYSASSSPSDFTVLGGGVCLIGGVPMTLCLYSSGSDGEGGCRGRTPTFMEFSPVLIFTL